MSNNKQGIDTSKWSDISTEEWREYIFPDSTIRISKPARLNVSKSGGHRILDQDGVSYYVPPKWILLKWKADPAFSF